MKVHIVPGRQLTAEMCARWDEIQRSNPDVSSPFFRPEFTQSVAAVRNDVEVAVITGEQGVAGFFPYQRRGWSSAQPVAGRLSDFHGLIARRDFTCDPRQLLQQCGLTSWRFEHVLESQHCFGPYMWTRKTAPFLDLSGGFPAYYAERCTQNSELPLIKRKLAKLGREVGPVRFEWHSSNPDNLQTLARWKSAHYQRTGFRDLFTFEWIRNLFDRLLEQNTPEFSGLLNCLYAGEHLIAAHLGICSRNVMHWWFPSYDRTFARYSPGLGLIYLFCQQANERGVMRVDLGQGDEHFKHRLASHVEQVAEGSVDLRFGSRIFRRTWQGTRDWVRASPLHGPTQAPLRWIRWMRDWLSFQ